MEELHQALRHLGLSETEISIYTKLIFIKESTASNLGKELKTHRRGIYDITERLVSKGIISYIEKDGKKYYKPVDPKVILEKLDEKKAELESAKKSLSGAIPKISEISTRADAEIMFGREGIKNLYLDELAEGKQINVICTVIDRTEDMLRNFLVSYTRDRVSRKIPTRIIAAEESRKQLSKYQLLEARFLPSERISPSSIVVYGSKVAIILWTTEPVVILIRNMEIAKDFMNHFETIWKAAKK